MNFETFFRQAKSYLLTAGIIAATLCQGQFLSIAII